MTNEEIIANEKYHTCGRCQWEDIPYICHRCKWEEDTRRDLWELKDELKTMQCKDCAYADIYYWELKATTGKAKPILWCEKHRCLCSDITDCEHYTEDSEDE